MAASSKLFFGFWRNRKYHLDQMDMRALVRAYFQHYAVHAYLALGVFSSLVAWSWMEAALPVSLSALAAVMIYPLVWYLLHRFVLHSQILYRSPLTARVWKRIHYDHHQDPNDLYILFGALYTTLPTVAVTTAPLGYAIGGAAGAAAGFAAGLFTTCFYEFCHCVEHLGTTPKSAFLKRMKAYHLAHHYHNETGNFGITNFFWDRLFNTFYGSSREKSRSPSVHNLGYSDEVAERYPWVMRLSEGSSRHETGSI